jgi:hypothetical protein
MMNWKKNIEAYLSDQLSPHDRDAFYAQLQQDQELRSLVIATKKKKLLEAVLAAELMDDADMNDLPPVLVPAKHKTNNRLWLILAMVLASLGIAGYLLSRQQVKTTPQEKSVPPASEAEQDTSTILSSPIAEHRSLTPSKEAAKTDPPQYIDSKALLLQLAVQHFIFTKPLLAVDTSTIAPGNFGAGNLLEEAKQAFNQGDFQQVLRLTEEVSASSAQYLRALAYLALKHGVEAFELFSQILQNPTERYAELWWNKMDVEWFRCLAKMQIGLNPKKDLEKILTQKSHKHYQAADRLYRTLRQ